MILQGPGKFRRDQYFFSTEAYKPRSLSSSSAIILSSSGAWVGLSESLNTNLGFVRFWRFMVERQAGCFDAK